MLRNNITIIAQGWREQFAPAPGDPDMIGIFYLSNAEQLKAELPVEDAEFILISTKINGQEQEFQVN